MSWDKKRDINFLSGVLIGVSLGLFAAEYLADLSRTWGSIAGLLLVLGIAVRLFLRETDRET